MEHHKPVIAGFGEILWDLLPSGKQLGGAPANFAYHAGVLGSEAFPVSCVGMDDSGLEILQLLGKKGISGEYLSSDLIHPTGSVSVILGMNGVPSYTIHENVAWDFIPWSEKLADLSGRLDAVCFGSLAQRAEMSRETLRKFLDMLHPGCLKVFDINLRQHYFTPELIRENFLRSDILKLNDGELDVISGMMNLTGNENEMLLQLMTQFSLQMIALTKGEKGSVLMTPTEYSSVKAQPVEIADTVGAGDAFTAAMTLGWLRKQPLSLIHQQSDRLAGYVCSQNGAMPVIGDEILKQLE